MLFCTIYLHLLKSVKGPVHKEQQLTLLSICVDASLVIVSIVNVNGPQNCAVSGAPFL